LDFYIVYKEASQINKKVNELVLLSPEEALLKYLGFFLLGSMIILNLLDLSYASDINQVNIQRYSIMLVGSGALSISKVSFRFRRLQFIKEHSKTMFSGFRHAATNVAISKEAVLTGVASAAALGTGLGVTDQAIAVSTGVRASSQVAKLATGQIDGTEFKNSFKYSQKYVEYSEVHGAKAKEIYQGYVNGETTKSQSERLMKNLDDKKKAVWGAAPKGKNNV